MSRGPQGAAARLGSVCLHEQHPLFLGSFGTCGCPGQRWVLGLPAGRAFWGGPCVFPAQPRMRVQVWGWWGDSGGAAVSGWSLPPRTWERA